MLDKKIIRTEEEKSKIVNSLLKGVMTIVKKVNTGEIQSFISNREAAKFIGINQSGLSRSIAKNNFYFGQGFLVFKSSTDLDSILNCEAYKKATGSIVTISRRHTEASKEVIRQANLGKKLTTEMKAKLSLNSK